MVENTFKDRFGMLKNSLKYESKKNFKGLSNCFCDRKKENVEATLLCSIGVYRAKANPTYQVLSFIFKIESIE